jgi:hypothetical protein
MLYRPGVVHSSGGANSRAVRQAAAVVPEEGMPRCSYPLHPLALSAENPVGKPLRSRLHTRAGTLYPLILPTDGAAAFADEAVLWKAGTTD